MTVLAVAESVVERVAFSMWKAEAERAAPNVAKNRSQEEFREELDTTREKWIGLARAAIAAMPRPIEDETPTDAGEGVTIVCSFAIAGPWASDERDENDNPVWHAEVQTIGGHSVVAEVWGGNATEASRRAEVIMRALAHPTPTDTGLLSELVEALEQLLQASVTFHDKANDHLSDSTFDADGNLAEAEAALSVMAFSRARATLAKAEAPLTGEPGQ